MAQRWLSTSPLLTKPHPLFLMAFYFLLTVALLTVALCFAWLFDLGPFFGIVKLSARLAQ